MELRRHLGPVFQHKPRRSNWVQLADKYLAKFGTQFDFSGALPPTAAQLMEAARRARPSAPGPDGLPYEAWRRSPLGMQSLEEVALDLAA
eukprot:2076558-Pyramimonas_sp.AAC.1